MRTQKFWRVFSIIFVVHLIPVLYIVFCCFYSDEGEMGWLFFPILDFPSSLLYGMVEPWIFKFFNDTFIRFILFPAIFFQIIGVINWVAIVYIVKFIRLVSRNIEEENK